MYALGKRVSVIIPVYNVEEYLEECLKSVSEQTYGNLEIILVDDGSTDRSGAICDQWCERDLRFCVIHKQNGGLSDARNTGIKEAHGELIVFVDSDDVIHRNMVKTLCEVMEATHCPVCCCGVEQGTVFYEKESRKKIIPRIYTADQALQAIISETDVFVTVWNKLYKREVIKDIWFPVNKCNEDEYWTYQIIGSVSKVATVGEKYYGYRYRENSIMNSRYTLRRLDLLEAREYRQNFFEEFFPDLVDIGKCDLRFECIRAQQLSLLYLSKQEKKESREIIQKIVKRHPVKISESRRLPTGRRFWYLLSGISFLGTCFIRNKFHFGP